MLAWPPIRAFWQKRLSPNGLRDVSSHVVTQQIGVATDTAPSPRSSSPARPDSIPNGDGVHPRDRRCRPGALPHRPATTTTSVATLAASAPPAHLTPTAPSGRDRVCGEWQQTSRAYRTKTDPYAPIDPKNHRSAMESRTAVEMQRRLTGHAWLHRQDIGVSPGRRLPQ